MAFARRILAFGLTLAASGAARSAASSLPARDDAWVRVDTEHFTLFSDASASRTSEIGLEMEKLRAVLELLQRSSSAGSPVPTSVFVFKSNSALTPYKPLYQGKPSGATGFFQGTDEGNFIALTASWNHDPRPVVYHEYLHDFLRRHFPQQPTWYDEGLADFYSTFQASSKGARVGLPVDAHLWRLRTEAMLPLARLLAVRNDSPEYNEQSRQGIFYAESWALVHYLMRGNPRRTPQLGRFLVLLQEGKPQDEAFRAAFQADYATLQGELSRYVRQTSFSYRQVRFEELKLPTRTQTTPLTYEQTLCRLGDLLAHGSPDRLGDAQAYFEAVLAANPSDPDALAGMGLVRLRQERVDEAEDLLRRAVAAGSRDFRVPFHLGEMLMRSVADRPFVPGHLDADRRRRLDEARAALARAVEEEPDFAQGRVALGRTYLFEAGPDVSEGITQLEAAAATLQSPTDLCLDLANLYEQRGDREKAAQWLRQGLGPEADRVLAEKRKNEELQASLEHVGELLRDGRDEDALVLLEQTVSSAPPEVARALDDQLQALRRDAAKNRCFRRYNDAVARYNRRDLAGALSGFEAVAATADDAELARSAREQAQWVRHLMSQARPKRPTPKKSG